MSHGDDWPDMTWEIRRVMVRKTIRPVTLDESKNRDNGKGMGSIQHSGLKLLAEITAMLRRRKRRTSCDPPGWMSL